MVRLLGIRALLLGTLPKSGRYQPVSTLRLLFGDQLTPDISALRGVDRSTDTVLMMEVAEECSYVPHHPQKIALILSAMRHFAQALRSRGYKVDYVKLDDPENTGSFEGEIQRALNRARYTQIVATEPGEWRVAQLLRSGSQKFGLPLGIRPDERFYSTHEQFARWAEGRTSLRMEFFYRDMRRASGLLMDGAIPAGGRWNYDAENRMALPAGFDPPAIRQFEADPTTREVLDLVRTRFGHHFGQLEPFNWPVTREQSLQLLQDFIQHALPFFGHYQDAMSTRAPFLYHSRLSPALNIGLLTAREVCEAAEKAYRSGNAPLNATEGFIRQILGWREFVRGIYWLKMPDYQHSNALRAQRPLPSIYWGAPTRMRCVGTVVEQTRVNAYSHHIQRLMVTGNLALLGGFAPKEVEAWYLSVYADAFEWVELPNTHGMALYADGGLMASKPYAASGAYIRRMSDFCSGCAYDSRQTTGSRACPFNSLYWDFLIRHERELSGNPRMALPLKSLQRFNDAERLAISTQSNRFLESLQ